MNEIFEELSNKAKEKYKNNDLLLEEFIEENEEELFNKYCDIFPENINSDTMPEDVDLREFVIEYLMDEFEDWKDERNEE